MNAYDQSVGDSTSEQLKEAHCASDVDALQSKRAEFEEILEEVVIGDFGIMCADIFQQLRS